MPRKRCLPHSKVQVRGIHSFHLVTQLHQRQKSQNTDLNTYGVKQKSGLTKFFAVFAATV